MCLKHIEYGIRRGFFYLKTQKMPYFEYFQGILWYNNSYNLCKNFEGS